MKNLKAAIMIILGSFFIATGFAFAGDTAMGQLKNGAFDSRSAGDPAGSLKAAAAPEASKAAQVQEEKKPSAGEKVKKFLSDAKPYIVAGALGAFIAFALIGPAAILPGILIGVGLLVFAGL